MHCNLILSNKMKLLFVFCLLSLNICSGYANKIERVSETMYKHTEDYGFVWYRYLGENG